MYISGLSECLFCSVAAEDAWIVTEDVTAIPHPDALILCHILIVPRRHVAAFYDLDVSEQHRIWEVLNDLRTRIKLSLRVNGFDAGFVDGEHGDPAAHTYIHLIP